MYSAEPRNNGAQAVANVMGTPKPPPKAHVIRNDAVTSRKAYALYLRIKNKDTWLQSSSDLDTLSPPRSTLTRWVNEMGVPETGWVAKEALLVLKDGAFEVATVAYTASSRNWRLILLKMS